MNSPNHNSNLKNLKKIWLDSLNRNRIDEKLINSTLEPISHSDPIWTSNAILDFLNHEDENQNENQIQSSSSIVKLLIDLGLQITRVDHQSTSSRGGGDRDGNEWQSLSKDSQKAESLSIRFHLVKYRRLLTTWEKIFSTQGEPREIEVGIENQNGSHHQEDGDDDDPWEQEDAGNAVVKDEEIQDEYSNFRSNPVNEVSSHSIDTLNQSTTTPTPFKSIQSFLNSTPLNSFLVTLFSTEESSSLTTKDTIKNLEVFLTSLHPELKKELFFIRFRLMHLLIRSFCLDEIDDVGFQEDLEGSSVTSNFRRLIEKGFLSSLNQQDEEVSIWNLNAKVEASEFNQYDRDIVDDENLIQTLVELDLLEDSNRSENEVSDEKTQVDQDASNLSSPQSFNNLLDFYQNEIDSLQKDYAFDSIKPCLEISRWVSSFSSNVHWTKRLEKELIALEYLTDLKNQDENETNQLNHLNLENLRKEMESQRGRIGILKLYLESDLKNRKTSNSNDVNWQRFFKFLIIVSDLGEEITLKKEDNQVQNTISSSTSTNLFIHLILDLTSQLSSSNSNSSIPSWFSISTQLLKFNHQNSELKIPRNLEINLILSIFLGYDGHDLETLKNFDALKGILSNLSSKENLLFSNQEREFSQSQEFGILIGFSKSSCSSTTTTTSNSKNSFIPDLFTNSNSPLNASNSESSRFSQDLISLIPTFLKSFKTLLKFQQNNPKLQVSKSLNEIFLISQNLKEQKTLVRYLSRNLLINNNNNSSNGKPHQNYKFEKWLDFLDDLLSLNKDEKNENGKDFEIFNLLNGKDIVKNWFGGILSTGDFELFKQAHRTLSDGSIAFEFLLSENETENLILEISREFYDSSESLNLHRGGMKLAYDCLSTIPSTSDIKKQKSFIEATSKLSTFSIPSSISTPSSIGPSKVTAKEISSSSNRLIFVSLLLSSRPEIYKNSDMILDLGWKLSNTSSIFEQRLDSIGEKIEIEEGKITTIRNQSSKQLIEIKCLAMLIDSSIANENLLEGFNLSQDLVDKINEMRKRSQSLSKNQDQKIKTNDLNSNSSFDLLPIVEEIGWKSCFQLAKHPGWGEEEEDDDEEEIEDEVERNEIEKSETNETSQRNSQRNNKIQSSKDRDFSKRLKLMSQVISLCPKNQLSNFLEKWRSLDKEHFKMTLNQDLTTNSGNDSRLKSSKFITDSFGKVSDLSFISPFSSLFNSSRGASLTGGAQPVATKPKSNAPTGGFGKAAQLFDGFGDSNNASSNTGSPWDYANVALDPAERAARAARNFFGGFSGNSPTLGSGNWSSNPATTTSSIENQEKETSRSDGGNRNVSVGGFSISRGMGWLMGEEER